MDRHVIHSLTDKAWQLKLATHHFSGYIELFFITFQAILTIYHHFSGFF